MVSWSLGESWLGHFFLGGGGVQDCNRRKQQHRHHIFKRFFVSHIYLSLHHIMT